MKSFITYCKQYIYDHIDEYRGQMIYPCDLGFTLTEGPNYDGTLTYSTEEAKEYLREWWNEAADYYEYERYNFGTGGHNPFENPEAYMVCMVIEGVRTLIDQAFDEIEGVDWNEMVELTGDLIEQITEKVNENDTCRLF
jgi:hypothetical protein